VNYTDKTKILKLIDCYYINTVKGGYRNPAAVSLWPRGNTREKIFFSTIINNQKRGQSLL
jgi:hypothetical protein